MRATHHGAQAHAWPIGCHDLPHVLLTAPPASASVAFPLRLCEQPLRGRKLATSSQRVPWEFSGVQTLLTLAIMWTKSGSRLWCRQKNTRHAEAACRMEC